MLGGAELTLGIVEARHLFGDVPALAGRQRGAYAETLDPSRVALLTISLLHHLVQENPEVGLRLAERLAGRLHESREWIADVALKKVPSRLARFYGWRTCQPVTRPRPRIASRISPSGR